MPKFLYWWLRPAPTCLKVFCAGPPNQLALGQSMGNYRFFICWGKKYVIVCHSLFWCTFYETSHKKIGKKFKISLFIYFSFSFQPNVHNGRVRRGRVCGCGCWLNDRWQVAGDRWHLTGDRWHVTHRIWHLTQDTWNMTQDTFCKRTVINGLHIFGHILVILPTLHCTTLLQHGCQSMCWER